jgi:hypothetical protein
MKTRDYNQALNYNGEEIRLFLFITHVRPPIKQSIIPTLNLVKEINSDYCEHETTTNSETAVKIGVINSSGTFNELARTVTAKYSAE